MVFHGGTRPRSCLWESSACAKKRTGIFFLCCSLVRTVRLGRNIGISISIYVGHIFRTSYLQDISWLYWTSRKWPHQFFLRPFHCFTHTYTPYCFFLWTMSLKWGHFIFSHPKLTIKCLFAMALVNSYCSSLPMGVTCTWRLADSCRTYPFPTRIISPVCAVQYGSCRHPWPRSSYDEIQQYSNTL